MKRGCSQLAYPITLASMGNEMDRWIGESVVYLRGHMSQKALAAAMSARGHKWSQSTVWSVEKGDRPLRLAEAHDLAEALDATVEVLLVPPMDISYWRAVESIHRRVRDAQHNLSKAAHDYEAERQSLMQAIADGIEKGYDLPEGHRAAPQDDVGVVLVERAIREAAEEHARRVEAGHGVDQEA